MAKPENPAEYTRYEAEDDLVVYLSHDLLERQEPGTRKIRFYIGGYGGYNLILPEPVSVPQANDRPGETEEPGVDDTTQRH